MSVLSKPVCGHQEGTISPEDLYSLEVVVFVDARARRVFPKVAHLHCEHQSIVWKTNGDDLLISFAREDAKALSEFDRPTPHSYSARFAARGADTRYVYEAKVPDGRGGWSEDIDPVVIVHY
jgi:hypothetical protein